MAKKQESKIAVIYARYSSERQNEQSIKRLHNGHKFKGFKLVYGSTKRTFTDTEKVTKILLANGYPPKKPIGDAYNEIMKQVENFKKYDD